MFDNQIPSEEFYTKLRVFRENETTCMKFNNNKTLSITSALGLQLVFEYYCYFMGVKTCIDNAFIDVTWKLRCSSMHPVYAVTVILLNHSQIPDHYGENEVQCLKAIQEGCGLPEASYISESLAIAVNCVYPLCMNQQENCRFIAILDIGYSKASLSLVRFNSVDIWNGSDERRSIQVMRTTSTKQVSGKVIEKILFKEVMNSYDSFEDPSMKFKVMKEVQNCLKALYNPDCEEYSFCIENNAYPDDEIDMNISRSNFIQWLQDSKVFDGLQSLTNSFKVLFPVSCVSVERNV